jgi:hypothetical protein
MMSLNIAQEVAALKWLPAMQLRAKYAEVFGEPARSGNKVWLVRRLAWRLQALAEGDLSERARQRAAELACDADLRLTPPKGKTTASPLERTTMQTLPLKADARLPPPGTILTRKYRGELLQVQVLTHGFAFQGQVYPSLSAVAKAITGSHCNGFQFFKLGHKGSVHE